MPNSKSISLILFLLFSFCVKNDVQQKPLLSKITANELEAEILKLKNSTNLKPASLGIVVLDPSGNPLVNINGDQSLTPASTLKTVTTATALLILGKEFTFKTTLGYTGQINNGILDGNLYIKGGGDPTLGVKNYNQQLESWINKIKSKGIKKINGAIIADASIFDYKLIPNTWIWEDIGNYYGTGVSGLNFNKNSYNLYFKVGNKNTNAKILKTTPEIAGLQFNNEIKIAAAGSGDNAYIYGSPYSYKRQLRGTIPYSKKSFSIKGAIPDPALFTAQILKNKLEKNNVVIAKKSSTLRTLNMQSTNNTNFKIIDVHYSGRLSDIIKETNYKSINLYAECILKILGYQEKNEGSTEAGLDVINEYWQKNGVNTLGLFMEDGSGLSHSNAVSAHHITNILYATTQSNGKQEFINSLPNYSFRNHSTTLPKYLLNNGRIKAKSGYIKRVRGLVGYAKNLDDQQLTFAIMINNYSGSNATTKNNIEKILELIVRLKNKKGN